MSLSPTTQRNDARGQHNAPPRAARDDSLQAYFRKFLLEHQEQLSETELARRLGMSRKTP